MDSKLLLISSRGQITIPPSIRKALGSSYVEYIFDGKELILKPIQTKEDFLNELDQIQSKWEKKGGGLSLAQMKAKYEL